MRLLELFCGTKSVGRAFEAAGWDVVSVDIDPGFQPTVCCDVLALRVDDVVERFGSIDALWASPVCQMYSRARAGAKTPRDLEGADVLVQRVLDIAARLGVPYLFENPVGLLMTRPLVQGIPMAIVDYCMWGDERWDRRYRKSTCIFGSPLFEPSRPRCSRACGHIVNGLHAETAQRGSKYPGDRDFKQRELYQMPPALCEDFVRHFTVHINAGAARAAGSADQGAGQGEAEAALSQNARD